MVVQQFGIRHRARVKRQLNLLLLITAIEKACRLPLALETTG